MEATISRQRAPARGTLAAFGRSLGTGGGEILRGRHDGPEETEPGGEPCHPPELRGRRGDQEGAHDRHRPEEERPPADGPSHPSTSSLTCGTAGTPARPPG